MKQILTITLFFFSHLLFSQAKIDIALLPLEEGKILDYIILFKHQAMPETQNIGGKSKKAKFVYEELLYASEKSQKNLIIELKKENIYFESFYVVNALRVKSNAQKLKSIANRPEVGAILKNINISLDRVLDENPAQSRDAEPEWGIKKIEADSVWRLGFKGKNVLIGGQDTGYDWKVNPLKKKYKGYVNDSTANHNYTWHDAIREKSPLAADSLNPCGYDVKSPCDDNNHGTHTMGTMVGQDSSNSIGVAPESQWIACRNMERGNGQLSTYLECFNWFLAPTDLDGKNADVTKAPHVINNSWYCSVEEGCNQDNWNALKIAVENLKASGVVVVVSAGNSGPNCNTITGPPAFFDPSFTVGATAANDTIAGFSSRGLVSIDSSFRMKPDVSAPGRNVRSVIIGGEYRNFSGTSMAGPHVAGLVALVINANPKLEGEVEVIENIIRKTADPKFSDQVCNEVSGQAHPNPVYGYGRINALKAVELALVSNPSSVNNDNNDKAWTIYPNPSNGFINLKNPSIGNYKLKIFNSTGISIFSKGISNETTIDLSYLPNNIYYLEISGEKETFKYKWVKM